MRVLVACEFSGIVRDAFAARGHEAWSCDTLPTEKWGLHLQDDVLERLDFEPWDEMPWDLMIAHPPCTHLCVSGARWFARKRADGQQQSGVDFFMALVDAPIPRIAVENPVGVMSTKYRKPDQIIQPWQFGHPETKTTCLWLKGLPPLRLDPAKAVKPDFIKTRDGKRYSPIHYASGYLPVGERSRYRSRTFTGIAEAMAEQWGNL